MMRQGRQRREWSRTTTLLAIIDGFEIGEEFKASQLHAVAYPFTRADGIYTIETALAALRWLKAEPKAVVDYDRSKGLWRRLK